MEKYILYVPLKVKSNQPLMGITYFETKFVKFVVIVVESCFQNSS